MPLFAVKGFIVIPMTGLALCQPDLFLRFWGNVRCLGTVRTRVWWHGCVVVASLNVCVMPRIAVHRGFLPYCLMSYGIFTKALRTLWSMTLMRRSNIVWLNQGSAQTPPRGQQLLEAPNHLAQLHQRLLESSCCHTFEFATPFSERPLTGGFYCLSSLCRLEIDFLWA